MSAPRLRKLIPRIEHLLPHLILIAGCVLFLLYIYLYFDHGEYSPLDDSFISFRYARNLARGEGLVYNPGEKVEGYTNFLWTVLMGVAIRLDIKVILASNIISTIAGLLTIWIVFAFGVTEFKKPTLAVIPALMLGATTSYARYVVSGSEMTLFTMFVVLGLYLYARSVNAGSSIVPAALTIAIAGLIRPEGVYVFGIVSIHYIKYLKSENSRIKKISTKLILWVGSFGLIYLPYFLWRYSYYGFLFPNTFYVKVGEPNLALILRGLSYILYALPLFNPQAALLIPLGIFWAGSRQTKSLLYIFIGFYIVYLIVVGGDFLPGFGPRFVIPILPSIYLLGLGGLLGLSKRLNQYRRRILGMLAFSLLFLIFIIWSTPERTSYVALAETQHRGWIELAKWMSKNVEPGQTLAVDAAGIIPYYTDLYTIDMLGLTDLHIARLDIGTGDRAAGHEKFDPKYVLDRCPTFIGTFIDQDGRPKDFGLQEHADRLHQEYALLALTLMRPPMPGELQVLSNPEFTPALFNQGYIYGILMRNETADCTSMP